MGAYIKAISYYLPERVITNEDLVKDFPEWDVEKVYNKVGVKERHLAGESETAGDLAEKAALKLFQEYNVSPADIDFLLLCTQSPDYHLPSTACILQDRLGIPTSAGAFDYDLGCSGCIYGMAVAKGLIAAGLAALSVALSWVFCSQLGADGTAWAALIASAVWPSAFARSGRASTRHAPSSRLYSLWTWRWTKAIDYSLTAETATLTSDGFLEIR